MPQETEDGKKKQEDHIGKKKKNFREGHNKIYIYFFFN